LKLQVKLILYNAFSKALIILAIGLVLPLFIQKIVYNHIDQRLNARMEKMLRMIQLGGLNEITLDQSCSYDSYNIFKEEYVSISPLPLLPPDFGRKHFENTERIIENETVKHRVLSQAFIYDNQLYEIEIGEGLSTVDQLNSTIRSFTFWMMCMVVLISVFLDLGFARILLRPFNKIVNIKLKDIGHPNTFNPTPVNTNTWEFAYLDRNINEMMGKIQEAFKIEREFITNVSHELLTPISILQNRFENMLNDPALPHEVAIKLVESQKSLSRLTRVVKALLYISKIENDQFQRNDSADLHILIDEILEELDDRILEKKINVSKEWKDEFTYKECNRSLIQTLLYNILSNAVKYNQPSGRLHITGECSGDLFKVKIRDTGVGIHAEHLPHIFDRFKRFHPEDGMSYGLGLPIVRSIAEFHGIALHAESKPGEGTEFTLTFRNNSA
jgi:signal transduction histidine kinase